VPTVPERIAALQEAPDRLLWAVRVRWLTIAGFFGLSVAAHRSGLFTSVIPVATVAVLGGIMNAVNGWCVRQRRYIVPVSAIAIPLDHVFVTYLVIHTGGVQSPFLMLYAVQVLATAMLVDTWVAAASALLAIVLWSLALGGQSLGYVEVAPVFRAGMAPSAAVYQATWAAFLFYCLALLVYLGGYISTRLGASERDLAAQNRRLAETLSSLTNTHRELQAAYDRLRQTEAHLIQSEKMRGLGTLVAGVAHELNNPISVVSANVAHLRRSVGRLRDALEVYDHLPLPEAQRAQLAATRRSLHLEQVLADLPSVLDDCAEGARRTTQIVNGLRAFSRSDAGEGWQPADLHRGIESALGLLATRLRDHITVHRDFAELPAVECLPGQLNQVFMNLLMNAADAIGRRAGSIWIATQREPTPVVSIAIRDDGPGMPPDVCAKIFEPFFTTKPVGHGTGLGLSISYGIIQRHHGTLSVASTPGQGATFTITLPVRQPVAT